MTPIRFAIWAAVSTVEQARPGKVSIDTQIQQCREVALSKGWNETAGPFIAAGASRSFYVNLSDAEADIPALRALLNAAHANQYDVLVVYTYDRLGDLVDMVAQALRFDRKQLYSIYQAVDPQAPERFDPYSAEGEATLRDVARITQRFRINDMRRKWRSAVPARVRNGLPALRFPYGYIFTSKKTPPRLDSVAAAVIRRIAREFLEGRSLRSIALGLSADGILSPQLRPDWQISTVRIILVNPFYAGLVCFGRTSRVHDVRRKNKYRAVRQSESRWVTAPGLHEPVWDEKYRQSILIEFSRRGNGEKRFRARYPISGLLSCSICGRPLQRRNDGGTRRKIVLVCQKKCSHIRRLFYETALGQVAKLVTAAIGSRLSAPPIEDSHLQKNNNEAALRELKARRSRIQEGFELGLYTKLEAAERLAALQRQEDALEQNRRSQYQIDNSWKEWKQRVTSSPNFLERFPEWMKSEDPIVVNKLLSSIIETVIVTPEHEMSIVWRR